MPESPTPAPTSARVDTANRPAAAALVNAKLAWVLPPARHLRTPMHPSGRDHRPLAVVWLVFLAACSGGRDSADTATGKAEPASCTDGQGVVHAVGETWEAGDGCNTCSCEGDDSWSCTELACGLPTTVDECGWSSLEPLAAARLLVDGEQVSAWDAEGPGLTVVRQAEELAAWCAHAGLAGSVMIDFPAEVGVGFIGDWSPGRSGPSLRSRFRPGSASPPKEQVETCD